MTGSFNEEDFKMRLPPELNKQSSSLLDEINSDVRKLVSLNEELLKQQRSELPKRHDNHDMEEIYRQKAILEKEIEIKVGSVQKSIKHRDKILYCVLFGFIITLFSLSAHNFPLAIAMAIISLNMYFITSYISS